MQLNIETPTTDLATIAVQITEYSTTAAALGELRSKYAKVLFPVTTTSGMKDAIAARAELRNIRVGLEKMRKEIKEPALERCRLIDSEAKTITAALTALEDPIDAQIKAQEAKLAAEKAERERKEAERKAALQAKVDAIRNLPLGMEGETAAEIATEIEALRQFEPTEAEFFDYAQAAKDAANAAIVSMLALHERRVAKEAADAEAERQRAEQVRIAAEQEAERVRLAALAAELEAKAKAERDAAAARAAAKLAEQQRVAAETKRQLEEQQAAINEARRLAEQEVAAARQKLADEQAAFQAKLKAQADEDQRRKDELAAAEKAEKNAGLVIEGGPHGDAELRMATQEVIIPVARIMSNGAYQYGDAVPVAAAPAVDETVVGLPAPTEAPAAPPTLRLGQIAERLGFALTADQLRALGFEPAGRDKAAVLFHEHNFPNICVALVERINAAKAAWVAA